MSKPPPVHTNKRVTLPKRKKPPPRPPPHTLEVLPRVLFVRLLALLSLRDRVVLARVSRQLRRRFIAERPGGWHVVDLRSVARLRDGPADSAAAEQINVLRIYSSRRDGPMHMCKNAPWFPAVSELLLAMRGFTEKQFMSFGRKVPGVRELRLVLPDKDFGDFLASDVFFSMAKAWPRLTSLTYTQERRYTLGEQSADGEMNDELVESLTLLHLLSFLKIQSCILNDNTVWGIITDSITELPVLESFVLGNAAIRIKGFLGKEWVENNQKTCMNVVQRMHIQLSSRIWYRNENADDSDAGNTHLSKLCRHLRALSDRSLRHLTHLHLWIPALVPRMTVASALVQSHFHLKCLQLRCTVEGSDLLLMLIARVHSDLETLCLAVNDTSETGSATGGPAAALGLHSIFSLTELRILQLVSNKDLDLDFLDTWIGAPEPSYLHDVRLACPVFSVSSSPSEQDQEDSRAASIVAKITREFTGCKKVHQSSLWTPKAEALAAVKLETNPPPPCCVMLVYEGMLAEAVKY